MSQENIEVVARVFERWNAGDVEGWLACWHANAEWVSEPFQAFDGEPRKYRGHEGLRRFPADVLEGFADLGKIERPRLPRPAGGAKGQFRAPVVTAYQQLFLWS
jgi:hypothetical protein